jgi:AcrR family transcriptional regulator
MPRITPPDRNEKLLDAAASAFVAHGYARTQMDDIAERLGVSKGTIYRTVESKEMLFAAVIASADVPDERLVDAFASVRDVAGVTSAVAGNLATAVAGLELTVIVANRRRLRSVDNVGDEVERITVGLHSVMRRHRTSIMVLDRCADEIPGLGAVWFGEGRYALVDLWHDYLTLRSTHVADDVDPAILARTIVEIVTTWAVKMAWDPAPRPYPDDNAAACATMIRHLLVRPTR